MQDLKNGSNEDENPKQTADAAPAAVADRYRRDDFVAHLGAGVTVGMIVLPLALGFGIASSVTPQQGLWTGIIASIAVALLAYSSHSPP